MPLYTADSKRVVQIFGNFSDVGTKPLPKNAGPDDPNFYVILRVGPNREFKKLSDAIKEALRYDIPKITDQSFLRAPLQKNYTCYNNRIFILIENNFVCDEQIVLTGVQLKHIEFQCENFGDVWYINPPSEKEGGCGCTFFLTGNDNYLSFGPMRILGGKVIEKYSTVNKNFSFIGSSKSKNDYINIFGYSLRPDLVKNGYSRPIYTGYDPRWNLTHQYTNSFTFDTQDKVGTNGLFGDPKLVLTMTTDNLSSMNVYISDVLLANNTLLLNHSGEFRGIELYLDGSKISNGGFNYWIYSVHFLNIHKLPPSAIIQNSRGKYLGIWNYHSSLVMKDKNINKNIVIIHNDGGTCEYRLMDQWKNNTNTALGKTGIDSRTNIKKYFKDIFLQNPNTVNSYGVCITNAGA